MGKIKEVLAQLPIDINAIGRGIGWDNEMLPFGVTLGEAREEARQHVFENEYAERLWLAIIFLAALNENKDYRKKESGLFDCQSAVFYLDTVTKSFSAMIEAMEKTSAKLAKDGNPGRADLYEGLTEELKDLKDKILNVRGIINRY
ncbi:MAG: hypothetical protein PHP25_02900 [Candidatus Moranbacteria bacterium]|nr:hypothetical protein [Candidatus Moranbacteria bacterium]